MSFPNLIILPNKIEISFSLQGAIFGSLEVLADRSILKEQYIQDKKIPDWSQCDITTETAAPVEELQRPSLSRRQTSGITSTLSSLSSKLSSHILSTSSSRIGSQLGSSRLGSSSVSSTSKGTSKSIKESPAEEKKGD
jgi:hypothetical protein